ncbi:hypothetical protein [Actinoplanes sp. NPDC023714]|uniref:hypothetical protein n=1 Tax=Actinoplanes sp. NPDC023714 TaxID=3154322 RepID=UPI0033C3F3D8
MGEEWTLFTEDEVLRAAGEGAKIQRSGPSVYAAGGRALIIVLDAGDRPAGTRLADRRTVELRGPFPDPVVSWFDRAGLPWLLYARLAGGDCVPLGRSGGVVRRDGDDLDLVLEEPLPFPLLDLLRPDRERRLPDLGWLTMLPHDKVGALRAFAEGWYADMAPAGTEEPEAATPLPVPLQVFYRLAAREPLMFGVHNEIYRPHDLEYDEDEGGVIVAAENQGVWVRVVDPDEDDPEVHDDGDPDEEPLSGFLLQFTLAEAVMAAPYRASAELTDAQWKRLAQRLTEVPLARPAFLGPAASLHVAPGLVVIVQEGQEGNEGGVELTAGTFQRPALDALREPGVEWN